MIDTTPFLEQWKRDAKALRERIEAKGQEICGLRMTRAEGEVAKPPAVDNN